MDSALKQVDSTKYNDSNLFYDDLLNTKKKSELSSIILKSIFVGSKWKDTHSTDFQLVEQTQYYKKFQGKKIRKILIFRSNIVIHNDSLKNPIEKWHVMTRQYVIRQNLFFKEGQTLKADEMVKNQRYLRSLRFLSDAYIILQPVDKEQVDVVVYTLDNFSFAPGFSALGGGKFYTFAGESNMLGTGNKFELGTILNIESPVYRGFKTEYLYQNIASSFFDLDLFAYKDLSDANYHISSHKPFILPTDIAGGATFEVRRYSETQLIGDTTVEIGANRFEVWAGKSLEISQNSGSYFLTSSWADTRFPIRYDVSRTFNRNYQNSQRLLFSTGIYHENFYRGTLIYGFGRTEDIPYGYKIEAVGGHAWEEFGNRWYVGTKLQAANMTHYGFANAKIELGSFINQDNKQYEQTVLSIENSYFTKLIPAGNWGFRCFFSGKYMRGFNRLDGEGETLYLNSSTAPRSIREYQLSGLNKLLLSTETVGFSPLYIYNFRFAFYGFADWAWLGNYSNVFKNDQFTSVGLGVRIKNERLIFQTIQLRIGFAVKNPTNASTNWLDVSEEARMRSDRLIPGKADVVEYR